MYIPYSKTISMHSWTHEHMESYTTPWDMPRFNSLRWGWHAELGTAWYLDMEWQEDGLCEGCFLLLAKKLWQLVTHATLTHATPRYPCWYQESNLPEGRIIVSVVRHWLRFLYLAASFVCQSRAWGSAPMPTYSLALPFEVSRIAVNTVLFGTASRVEVRLGMKNLNFEVFWKFNTFTLGNFGERSCWTPKDSLKSLKKQACNWTLMVGRSVTLLRWLGCWCACHVVIPDRSLVLHVSFWRVKQQEWHPQQWHLRTHWLVSGASWPKMP